VEAHPAREKKRTHSELEIVALPSHGDDDAADPEPATEERAEPGDDGRGPAGESRQAQAVRMVKRMRRRLNIRPGVVVRVWPGV
jgi:hypothetical protein